jgi:hypothetical protein
MKSNSGYRWFFAISAVLALFFVSSAGDQMKNAPIKVKKVSLFKNGLGFFNAEVAIPNGAETIRVGQIPVPVYGTFWVAYSDKVKVRSLVTGFERVDEEAGARTIAQLLAGNIGRTVQIRTTAADKDPIEGMIVKMEGGNETNEQPNPYFMDRRTDHNSRGGYDYSGQGGVVLVKTSRGLSAIATSNIIQANIVGNDVKNTVTLNNKRPSIRVELERPVRGETMTVSFLAKGVTWSPSYCIDITDPQTARLSAKAVVINEVMNLENISCELVTGFPNIAFSDVVGPEAMSQNLAQFLQALDQGRSEPNRRSTITQQAVVNRRLYEDDAGNVVPAYRAPSGGAASEDLFFYPVENFSLKKGETALLPLFTASMPCQHIYIWEIEDFVDNGEQYRSSSGSDDAQKPAEEVWHSCRLKNSLGMPLTTAAAEFISGGAFAGQDICYYTAPGAQTTIRINRALNVMAEQAEIEVERKRGVTQFYGYSYDLVKVKGEMKVKNRLDKIILLEATKHLTGEILQKPQDAKDLQTAKGLKQVNPRHVLTLEMKLKPNEERTSTYVYQVYIHN